MQLCSSPHARHASFLCFCLWVKDLRVSVGHLQVESRKNPLIGLGASMDSMFICIIVWGVGRGCVWSGVGGGGRWWRKVLSMLSSGIWWSSLRILTTNLLGLGWAFTHQLLPSFPICPTPSSCFGLWLQNTATTTMLESQSQKVWFGYMNQYISSSDYLHEFFFSIHSIFYHLNL